MKKNPVIVLGLYLPAIAILNHLRSLHYYCIGISHLPSAPGFKLKGKQLQCPSPTENPEELLAFLLKLAKPLKEKPVLFVTSDDYIEFLDMYSTSLIDFVLFPFASAHTANAISSKDGLAKFVQTHKLDAPVSATWTQSTGMDKSELTYPCIIKPKYAYEWRTKEMKSLLGFSKVLQVNSSEELDGWLSKISAYCSELIVQEIIPGPDDNLYYFVAIADQNSKIVGHFCGRKLRITPIHYGSASYVKTTDPAPLFPIAQEIVTFLNYRGPCGIEFKYDPRDNKYKLIEINARFGLWDLLSLKLDIDLASIYIQSLLGDVMPQTPKNDTKYWISITRDIAVLPAYRTEYRLSLLSILQNYLSANQIAEWDSREPSIFFHMLFSKAIHKLKGKLHV